MTWLLAACLSGLPWAPVASSLAPLVSGPVEAVAAGADLVVAVRGAQSVVMSTDGRVLRRIGGPRSEAATRNGARPTEEEIFQLYGMTGDDLEPPYANGPAADEPVRGHDHPAVVAASDHEVWISRRPGLLRVPKSGRSVLFGGRHSLDLLAVSASGGSVAGLSGTRLIASNDGARTFSVVGRPARRPVAVAIAPAAVAAENEGTALLTLDDEGLTVWQGERPGNRVLAAPGRDMASCGERWGERWIVLADDGIHEWSPGVEAKRLGPPLPARRLACDTRSPGIVAAAGPGVVVSLDGGRTWRRWVTEARGEVRDIAMTEGYLWVAAEDGLFRVPVPVHAPVHVPGQPRAPVRTASRESRPELPPLGSRVGKLSSLPPIPAWASWLPRLAVVVTSRPSGPRDEVAAIALLTIPLGRGPPAPSARARVERRALRPRAAWAGRLASLPAPGQDEAADAERALLEEMLGPGAFP